MSNLKRVKNLLKSYKEKKKEYKKTGKTPSNYKEKPNLRGILGEDMAFSLYPSGEYSFPGPDITFTPPPSNSLVVCLGCMENQGSGDNISIIWPKTQVPSNFGTGSAETNTTIMNGRVNLSPVNWMPIFFPDINSFTTNSIDYVVNNQNTIGQPLPTSVNLNESEFLSTLSFYYYLIYTCCHSYVYTT